MMNNQTKRIYPAIYRVNVEIYVFAFDLYII